MAEQAENWHQLCAQGPGLPLTLRLRLGELVDVEPHRGAAT